jgi:acetyl-CoA C-acetyltransferase
VAIVGMGCSKFGENWNMSANDMIVDACHEALEDAGMEMKDIEAAWLGTTRGTTGQVLSQPMKTQYIPVTRVENACCTGSEAIRGAAYAVAAGIIDVAMAVGVEKLKDSGYSGLGSTPDPGHNVEPLSTNPANFAMLASAYFSRYGLSYDDGKHMIGRISWKSHQNGAKNPKAHLQKEVSMEAILNAPMISWPLGLFDCCGVSDGAAAAILVRADMAKSFRKDPVFLKALQVAIGPGEGWVRKEYDYCHCEESYRAGLAAYKEAGITNPREEISMAEVHDCFSITEAVTMEDLQFSPRGKVRDDIENGFFDLDGNLPVQPDGGLKCFGHPIGASGIRMMYEMYKQLQGKAGSRQIKNPKLGLTHNLGGQPGAFACFVGILGLEGM